MIRDAGAGYVIVGHSERRRLFGDTDERVNRKIVAVLANDLTPIVCIAKRSRSATRTRRWPCSIAKSTPHCPGSRRPRSARW